MKLNARSDEQRKLEETGHGFKPICKTQRVGITIDHVILYLLPNMSYAE